jgi:hypothetical protein
MRFHSLLFLTLPVLLLIQQAAPTPRTEGMISGLTLDDQGRPVEGAQIIIDRVGLRGQMHFVNSDEKGRFSTGELVRGLYAMNVQYPGYIPLINRDDAGFYRPGEHVLIRLIKGGVITGRVTNAFGEPVVLANLHARRLRDEDGRSVVRNYNSEVSDDRGIYRIYGLAPGDYVISAALRSGVFVSSAEAEQIPPSYHPSSSRAAAAEISVTAGQEVSGVDIQMRNEPGHALSGVVSGVSGFGAGVEDVQVKLLDPRNRDFEKTAAAAKDGRYVLFGIPDGEYLLSAQRIYGAGDSAGAAVRRIAIHGADQLGVDLKLVAYASISGRVLLDSADARQSAPRCETKDPFQINEISLNARPDETVKSAADLFIDSGEYWGSWRGAIVDPQGTFLMRNLSAGRYRLEVRLPGETHYVRSISSSALTGASKPADLMRAGVLVKQSEKLSGVEIRLSEGAASLRGRVSPANPSAKDSQHLRVHLIPAEETGAGELLRYAETVAETRKDFVLRNLRPGKYWILARPIPYTESFERNPAVWNEAERLRLRRDAKKANLEIELKPCQRLTGVELKG